MVPRGENAPHPASSSTTGVRAATPPGALGKVYGFVYSGLDLGEARMIFVVSAGLMLLTIATVVQVRRHAVPAGMRAAAR